ncbi:MAG TPA: hypothetical protein PKI35_09135, partial [Bacteroidales bacterium]|nr:hypothetical protein [Bacteroidales bacterium]
MNFANVEQFSEYYPHKFLKKGTNLPGFAAIRNIPVASVVALRLRVPSGAEKAADAAILTSKFI